MSASALPGEPTVCAASIGIALYPEDGDCAADLIDRADEAMYLAKQRGGRACAFCAAP
ncbi:MAG: diguanylate cyclase [Burkholderiaceae bacterium]